MMDRRIFFDAVRGSVFRGSLAQRQVDGLNHLLDVWQMRYRDTMIPAQLAYCLATSYHETAHTMQPVRETLASSDAQAIRRLDAAWKAGRLKVSRPYWRTGYFGRGHVQLTHESNYRHMGHLLDVDLAGNPGLALDPEISADILFTGMMGGHFTGKGLARYVSRARTDFKGARRVVNGMDRAGLIAGYADAFLEALLSATRNEAQGGDEKPEMPPAPPAGPAIDIPAPSEPPAYEPPAIEDVVTGKKDGKSTTIWTAILQSLVGSAAAILAALQGLAPWLAALIVVTAVGAGLYIWRERRRHARENGV